jgi:hypothetical protein
MYFKRKHLELDYLPTKFQYIVNHKPRSKQVMNNQRLSLMQKKI